MADSRSKKGKDRDKKSQSGSGREGRFSGMFEEAIGLSSKAFKYAASTTSMVSSTFLKTPERLELMGVAGRALKDMRQTAGLSIEELSSVIDLENPDILRAVEEGKTGLPMDIMMRLASYYSRNDPLPFIIRFSRTYHPWLSTWLNMTGIDRLLIKAERELKFLKIYRNVDAARDLSDAGFDEVLAFTRQAFNMAMHFVSEKEAAQDAMEESLAAKQREEGKKRKKADKTPDPEPDAAEEDDSAKGGAVTKAESAVEASPEDTPAESDTPNAAEEINHADDVGEEADEQAASPKSPRRRSQSGSRQKPAATKARPNE